MAGNDKSDKSPKPVINRAQVIDRQRNALLGMSHQMLQLADNLTESGRPLKDEEKKLIKLAMAPQMEEAFKMVMVEYLYGDGSPQVLDLIEDLMQV